MRFMMIVKANEDSERGIPPGAELVAAMTRYNEELARAGVLLDMAGLRSSAYGVRVLFDRGTRRVVHGPFPEEKDLVAGYWIIQVKSKEEAIEWAKRAPCDSGHGAEAALELRQLHDIDDFAQAQ